MTDITRLRNIGISAHIDSGKTTLSERILFYAGRIHRMQEIRGDGEGATLDHMELERERGITITSAATTVTWDGHAINLIDTPGHVDFTVEVERSLRVLDGAVLVLCAVGGVQPQTLTVDRQMRRYHTPRLALVNKMDRVGADPQRVVEQMRSRMGCEAILVQLPIGQEEDFRGVVDLVSQQAVYFEGRFGEQVRHDAIPEEMASKVAAARGQVLEALAMYSDPLMELLLAEQEVPEELIHRVLREAVHDLQVTPVLLGSAYRNKGVQPLLDAVNRYLPSPDRTTNEAHSLDDPDATLALRCDASAPLVAMAFKVVDDPYGQMTFMQIYQGTLAKGQTIFNQRSGTKERVSRVLRIHADAREEIEQAVAGDIVAVMGIDSASGDTYAGQARLCTLQNMYVPDPVITVAVRSRSREGDARLAKALARFRKEDPTFRVTSDPETGETLMAGMGELHLEVYAERMRREYRADVELGAPKVSYRETITGRVAFNHRHRKQTGGAGQYAHVIGHVEPLPAEEPEELVFDDEVVGGRVPRQFIPAVERGFREAAQKGPVAEFPIVGVRAVLSDGSSHEVDSSDLAFGIAARDAFREAIGRAAPVLLEPVMRMVVEVPAPFQGAVTGELTGRRAIIVATESRGTMAVIEAEVPLAETFGYSTDLRSMTQGQGTFTMELARYRRVPAKLQQEIAARQKAERAGRQLVGAK